MEKREEIYSLKKKKSEKIFCREKRERKERKNIL